MKREELFEAVIEALRETQSRSGQDADAPITEATVPVGDLIEFDSLNGVEATAALEERLGRPLPLSLFTDLSTHRPLSVGEVVERLLSLEHTKESPS